MASETNEGKQKGKDHCFRNRALRRASTCHFIHAAMGKFSNQWQSRPVCTEELCNALGPVLFRTVCATNCECCKASPFSALCGSVSENGITVLQKWSDPWPLWPLDSGKSCLRFGDRWVYQLPYSTEYTIKSLFMCLSHHTSCDGTWSLPPPIDTQTFLSFGGWAQRQDSWSKNYRAFYSQKLQFTTFWQYLQGGTQTIHKGRQLGHVPVLQGGEMPHTLKVRVRILACVSFTHTHQNPGNLAKARLGFTTTNPSSQNQLLKGIFAFY